MPLQSKIIGDLLYLIINISTHFRCLQFELVLDVIYILFKEIYFHKKTKQQKLFSGCYYIEGAISWLRINVITNTGK